MICFVPTLRVPSYKHHIIHTEFRLAYLDQTNNYKKPRNTHNPCPGPKLWYKHQTHVTRKLHNSTGTTCQEDSENTQSPQTEGQSHVLSVLW